MTIRMVRALSLMAAVLAVVPVTSANAPALVPRISGETLDGQKIVLPEAAGGKVTLLLVGASKKAGDRTKEWKEKFLADFGANENATYYVVALLERAPAMIRGMIRSGMKSGTAEGQRAHVVTSTTGEKGWLEHFHVTDDALPMVVLLDKSAQMRWFYAGEFNAEKYGELKAAVASAISGK